MFEHMPNSTHLSQPEEFKKWYAHRQAFGFNGITKEDIVKPAKDYDVISKPKHYMLFEQEGIEVRDVIEKLVRKVQGQKLKTVPHYTKEAALFESDYVQLMQYLMRFMDKNGKEDLEKARWYLDKMIEAY